MEVNNVDEEDEDVVIQGSALHKHLSQLGYADFECVSMSRETYPEEKHYLNIIYNRLFYIISDIQRAAKKIYAQLFSFYSWIIQERSISKKQLSIISNAEALLDDHASMINIFLAKHNNDTKKVTLQDVFVTATITISSAYVSLYKCEILTTLFASSAICCAGYMKHLRSHANRDLRNVISLQNKLFTVCKESLKILRRDYTIRLDSETCVSQFSHFLGNRVQYLQPLVDALVEFMENISYTYYQCSLSIAKMLSPDTLNEDSYTKFDCNSFRISGEIDYQVLKKLYHIYLLVQSEMLYLLAIAYDSNTWVCSRRKIPETRLACIICTLNEKLTMYEIELSKALNTYDACKAKPIRQEIRDINRAKWHDPTVQLDLASHKLQLAYNQVFSVFKDIDDCIARENSIDDETVGSLMQNLDKAFKEIDAAKSLAEFVVLLMARSRFNDLRNNKPATDGTTTNQNLGSPVIIDSDPEILDEVFEEYIKEEYLKSLHDDEEAYEYVEQRKLDKLLTRIFMSELKTALVDKHKSMSERESKALQRMYKNISKDSALSIESTMNDSCEVVPVPPPMPPYDIWSTSSDSVKFNHSNCKQTTSSVGTIKSNGLQQSLSVREEINELDEKLDHVKAPKYKNNFNMSSIETNENKEKEFLMSLPQILLEPQVTQFAVRLPRAFLQEETFIGSGENSEDEILESNSNDNESNEHSEQ